MQRSHGRVVADIGVEACPPTTSSDAPPERWTETGDAQGRVQAASERDAT